MKRKNKYNKKKYNFFLRSLSTAEGTASSELTFIDNQSQKILLSGNYILKDQKLLASANKSDALKVANKERVSSLVISLNSKNLPGEIISGLLFGNNIFFYNFNVAQLFSWATLF
jgi:hypothetical protein